jgi:hypothetical protein
MFFRWKSQFFTHIAPPEPVYINPEFNDLTPPCMSHQAILEESKEKIEVIISEKGESDSPERKCVFNKV